MKLKDKIAVVTGAGQGIGRAIAVLAAREGARVALVERNEATGQETLDQITRSGRGGLLILKDITLIRPSPKSSTGPGPLGSDRYPGQQRRF